MSQIRKTHSPSFKAKVAVVAAYFLLLRRHPRG